MATFYLGMATLFLGLATLFLGITFFQNGYILVPHLPVGKNLWTFSNIKYFDLLICYLINSNNIFAILP